MAAYHQMGHDSWNLVAETNMYEGLILSPVNDTPARTKERLQSLGKENANLKIILDPQLYRPDSVRGKLSEWKHFAPNSDTVDLGNQKWWAGKCGDLIAEALNVGAHAIASPAILPKVFTPEYYEATVETAVVLDGLAHKEGLSTLISAIVHLPDLAKKNEAERIASILTKTDIQRIFLVFYEHSEPRDQFSDQQCLAAALKLIRLLKLADSEVTVAFTGLDMLLWKTAGAANVATGKFFNVRKFDPSRWGEEAEGGRNFPYWTSESLVTWLREDDLRLLLAAKMIDHDLEAADTFSKQILELLENNLGDAWLKFSWMQYMHWFAYTEASIDLVGTSVVDMLKSADALWAKLKESNLLMHDRKNDGAWVRAWLNAIALDQLLS